MKTEAPTDNSPSLSEHATPKEREAYTWCARLTEMFTAKGLIAFFGPRWDGAHDQSAPPPPFWYFNPRANGAVDIYYEHDDGAYNQHNAKPEDLEGFAIRFAALPEKPSSEIVLAAADAAAAASISAASRS